MFKKLFAVLAVAFLLSGCQAAGESSMQASPKPESSPAISAETGTYTKITAEEAKKMMDEQTVTIVDVRTKEEYEEGHVPGAISVPNEEITGEVPSLEKDAVLLVYCRSGVRSKEASEKLAALGYENVYDFGGIIDWPYDTVTD